MITEFARLFTETSPLLNRYRDQCAPAALTFATLENNDGAISLRVMIARDGEVLASATTRAHDGTAAALLAELVKDRQARALRFALIATGVEQEDGK